MRSVLALFAFFFLASCGQAATTEATTTAAAVETGALSITQAWAGPTPNGVDVSAGYLTITNGTTEADRLLSATSARASAVEIHEMKMDGAMMQMGKVDGLDIPAGGSVSLAPGGYHLMFTGVTQPFAEGETISVTLHFEKAGDMEVSLPVQREAAN